MSPMWIFLIISIALAVSAIASFNRLVSGRNILVEAWSGIDVLLKMRHDLAPNLVTTVRAYASHEKSTFEDTIQARDATLPTHNAREAAEAESHLNAKLVRVLALGVEHEWAESFTQMLIAAANDPTAETSYEPVWFRPYGVHHHGRFNFAALTSSISSSLTTSIASASTPPGSSSGFGDSGGGFSGGFSGGSSGGGGGGW